MAYQPSLVQVEPLQIQPHSRPIFEFPPAPRVKFPQIESRRIDRSQDEKTPASMKRKRELSESLSRSGLKIRTYPQSHTNPLKDPGHASQQADSSTTTSKSTATLQPSTPPLNTNRDQEAPASNTLLPTSPRAESLKHLREAEPYRADAAYREISEASDDEEESGHGKSPKFNPGLPRKRVCYGKGLGEGGRYSGL